MLIGGKPTDGCTLPPGEYFTVGTTHLAIGFTDEQWVLKPLPELKLGDDAVPASRTPEPEQVTDANPSAKIPKKTRRCCGPSYVAHRRRILGGLDGADSERASRRSCFLTEPVIALAALIEKHGVGETVKTDKTERGWIVQGHLQDRESLKALEVDCRVHIPASSIRLWDSETLATAAGEVLAAFRLPVAAAPGGAGRSHLSRSEFRNPLNGRVFVSESVTTSPRS